MRKRLHRGFLIVDDMMGGEFRAYRSIGFYTLDVPTFTEPHTSQMDTVIDEAGEYGEFTLEQFDEVTGTVGQPSGGTTVGDRLKEGTRLTVTDKDGNQLFSTPVGDLNIWDADPWADIRKVIAEGLSDDAFKPK